MNLKGQTAIISGGLGDIGRAIALELAADGANVSLGDVLPPDQAGGFLEQLRGYDVSAMYTQMDIRDASAVASWIHETASEAGLGIPSLIISNAGIVTRASFLDITNEQWDNEFAVNVGGALSMCRSAAQLLIQNGLPGKIVLVGSWAAHRPNKAIPAYCASKAALRMLGQVMAMELAGHGITVGEVAPGAVNAGLSAKNLQAMTPEQIEAKIPVGTWIRPEEVAWQVAHLCDPRNANMTGSVVVMDGGLSLTSKWT
ncbi:SDR family NAD(P)-dependent oxidoreductase [Paenibacillus cremeus]|uniref:SDR family oxidoreductase n=1 Tax=Paenibacillus cremeus TaxID=2163881 RepID=A0A559KAU0_9BACL|nr:SDR family oxidoreductase [Paenibacillus cremeus]TVY09242.1 SDR family oxidoreductase [Paenibacillus cremeus]